MSVTHLRVIAILDLEPGGGAAVRRVRAARPLRHDAFKMVPRRGPTEPRSDMDAQQVLLDLRLPTLRHSRRIVGVAPRATHARSRAVVMRPALIGVLLADPALIAETDLCQFRPIRRATPGASSNPAVSNQGVTPFDRSRESFVGRHCRLRIVFRCRRWAHWEMSRRHRRADPYQRLAVDVHRTTAKGAPTTVGITHTCLLGASDCHAIAKAGQGDSRMFHIDAIGSTR